MNKFTAQELVAFYQKVADGGEIEFNYVRLWQAISEGPTLGSSTDNWRIKPTNKVIDLSVLIESGIDCEFSDKTSERTTIGKLLGVTDVEGYPYKTGNSRADEYEQCSPRQDHIHAWQGGECPLPEGFLIALQFRGDSYMITTNYIDINWTHEGEALDIIAFEVLGLADGYVMPWEGE